MSDVLFYYITLCLEILFFLFQVTPVLGVVAVILVLIAVHEPKRGALETNTTQRSEVDGLSESVPLVQEHSYLEDLKKILKV